MVMSLTWVGVDVCQVQERIVERGVDGGMLTRVITGRQE